MSNIHSLFSQKKTPKENNSDGDESNDEDKGQSFYVGGSDHSGQEVLGPPSGGDLESHLFDAAKRAGAKQISAEEAEALYGRNARAQAFEGNSFQLGGHGMPTEAISQSQVSTRRNEEPIRIHLNIWTNGFSVDDGPLRSFDDPENRSFLSAVAHGQNPPELVKMYPNRKIDLHMNKKMTEYVQPKQKPFSGSGVRLGSIVPNVVGESSDTGRDVVELEPPPTNPHSLEEMEKLLKEAQDAVSVNDGQPSGRIQIRIPGDARPIIGRFNHSHTVHDLRNFISSARPDLAFQTYQIVVGRPPSSVDDESKTLKETDMINSVVFVKFT